MKFQHAILWSFVSVLHLQALPQGKKSGTLLLRSEAPTSSLAISASGTFLDDLRFLGKPKNGSNTSGATIGNETLAIQKFRKDMKTGVKEMFETRVEKRKKQQQRRSEEQLEKYLSKAGTTVRGIGNFSLHIDGHKNTFYIEGRDNTTREVHLEYNISVTPGFRYWASVHFMSNADGAGVEQNDVYIQSIVFNGHNMGDCHAGNQNVVDCGYIDCGKNESVTADQQGNFLVGLKMLTGTRYHCECNTATFQCSKQGKTETGRTPMKAAVRITVEPQANQPEYECLDYVCPEGFHTINPEQFIPSLSGEQAETCCEEDSLITTPFVTVTGECQVNDNCVTSPHYPAYYMDNSDCIIKVVRAGHVSPTHFITENWHDRMAINCAKFTGTIGPVDHPVAPHTRISWVADYSVVRTGWKICATAAAGGDDEIFQGGEGPCAVSDGGTCWSSPNYPNNYDNNANCEIDVAVEATIRKQGDFSVENHYDFIEFENNLGCIEQSGSWTAGEVPVNTGTVLHWHADYSVVSSGWEICFQGDGDPDLPVYTCADLPCPPGFHTKNADNNIDSLLMHAHQDDCCEDDHAAVRPFVMEEGICTLSDNENCITSPNYPSNYPHDSDCMIRITQTGKLYAEAFHTEYWHDRLAIGCRKYTGFLGPHDLSVVANSRLVWNSDYSVTYGGWKICGTAANTFDTNGVTHAGPCPTTDSGRCWTSPGHPNNYPNYDDCEIHVAMDATLNTEGDFRVESHHDYLEVESGGQCYEYSGSWNGGTGHGGQVDVVAGQDIHWHADYSVTYSGWKLCWKV